LVSWSEAHRLTPPISLARHQAAHVRPGIPKCQRNGHTTWQRVITRRKIRPAALHIEMQMGSAGLPTVAAKRDTLALIHTITNTDQRTTLRQMQIARDGGVCVLD